MTEKTGFFEESPGQYSMMRLCFFIAIVSMCALAFVVEIWGEWSVYNSTLIGSVISISSWMKVRQKRDELDI